MNVSELRDALRERNIDERFVSLDGVARDESLILERATGKGWCVYFSERGLRTGEHFFITEEEACKFIFDRLSRDPTVQKRTS